MSFRPTLALAAIIVLPIAPVSAASTMHPRISMDAARAKALQFVPHAQVKGSELERENGKLIYSFDLTVAGRPGVEEVQIDALSGKLVSRKHETAAKEAQEQRAESHEHH